VAGVSQSPVFGILPVGGFNPFEKDARQTGSFPLVGVKINWIPFKNTT